MSQAFHYYQEPVLPWTSTRNDQRFARILRWVLVIFIAVGLVIPWLPSPEVEKKSLKQVAPRLAKLITQKRKQPPAPPKIKTVKKKIVKKKIKKKVSKKKQAKARKKARQSGLMAMSRDIQDLQSMFDVASLSNKKPLQSSYKKSSKEQRSSVIASKAKTGSGGIDTSKLSRATGSSGLKGRSSTRVASNLGGGPATTSRSRAAVQTARAIEELNAVFDRYKGALQNIYQRALRRDPALQGKVVFEITINPAGRVIKARIISSELGNKKLERRLVARVKSFRFAARDVKTVTVTMPIDFLPSS